VGRTFSNWTLAGGGSISSTTANPTTYTYGTSNATLTANYGNATINCPAAPTRAGYEFNGWFTAVSGGSRRCGGSGGPTSYTTASSETLYAQWTSTCNYSNTINNCPSASCYQVGGASCVRDGVTYYQSCTYRCSGTQTCSAGSCVENCNYTYTLSNCSSSNCMQLGGNTCMNGGTTYYQTCTSKCTAGQTCSAGTCQTSCPDGYTTKDPGSCPSCAGYSGTKRTSNGCYTCEYSINKDVLMTRSLAQRSASGYPTSNIIAGEPLRFCD